MILGIDPGVANCGWAVVDRDENKLIEYGCIVTQTKSEMSERLEKIYCQIEKLIKKYKIESLAIEGIYFAKNVKSAEKVAEVIGVLKLCGAKNMIRVKEYTPLQIKMALVGYGRADKDQVNYMVKNILGIVDEIKPHHAVDAIAAAMVE